MENHIKSNSRPLVLIVDDEPSVLAVLAEVMTNEGFSVHTALSGEAALEAFQADFYAAVVTDVCMDGMSGFELIDRISKIDSAVKSVVITAHDSYDMIKSAIKSAAYDYFAKPLDNHEAISSCVHRAAQATQLIRDNEALVAQLQASHALLERVNQQYRLLNEELRVQANTDSLTEIHNRRFIDHTLLHEVNRRNRYSEPLSVVMIDIDYFKKFNDNYGHEGGDTVLKYIAHTLKDSSRNIDVVGRHGGEEFFIILPKTPPEYALIYAERVREKIAAQTILLGSNHCEVTISAGVTGVEAEYPHTEVSTLTNSADRALYRAKKKGRNRCCVELLGESSFGAEKRT